MSRKTIYYHDPLHDDFAPTNGHIRPKPIGADFPYEHPSPVWQALAFVVYRLIMTPFLFLYCKLVFGLRIENRKVLRELLLALDCDVELYKAGRMPIAQFAALPYDRDILTHVYIKKTPGLAVHYQSVRATQTDFPILTCAAARTADGAYRFAIGARPMKAMLVCPTAAPDELPAAVQAAVPTGSNLRGSAAYRTHLVGVLVKRAVQALGNLEVL